MPITAAEKQKIEAYCREAEGVSLCVVPSAATSSFRPKDGNIGVRFTSPIALQNFISFLDELNQDAENKRAGGGRICASVMGGGRSDVHGNSSYSIANLWEGTDVFMLLAWPPVIEILKPSKPSEVKAQEEKGRTLAETDVICRIPPNIMLKELNQQLRHLGYHCPELFGLLPFMSFAGGLSTNSHSAVAFLSDIVEGINVLLPNGVKHYYKRGSVHFDLICNRPTLGLLGVITDIDIRVKQGQMKLQRDVRFSIYSKFMQEIERDVREDKVDLNSHAVIFSPVGLNGNKIVKWTRWQLPREKREADGESKGEQEPLLNDVDVGSAGEQKVASSSAVCFASMLARNQPQSFAKVFETQVMNRKLAGTVVRNFEDIMGPEYRLAANITEAGIFFDYNSKEMQSILDKIEELFQARHLRSIYPVNAAIFIRFPKRGERQLVAIDLASFGWNLPAHEPFIRDLIIFLRGKGLKPGLHYGKSHGICASKICEEDSWSVLKGEYRQFYSNHGLDQGVLNIQIQCLELPDIRLQLNKILVTLQGNDVMAMIQAYAEFGELLEKNYPGKSSREIREELAKFDEYKNKGSNIKSDSFFYSLYEVMRRKDSRADSGAEFKRTSVHSSDPALEQLTIGLSVFIKLVDVKSQSFDSVSEPKKEIVRAGIKCFSAVSGLSKATEIKDEKDDRKELKLSGQAVLDKVQKALRRSMVPVEDLPKLTTFVEGATAVVKYNTFENITAHDANTKEVLGIKREWGKFVGSTGFSLLGTAIFVAGVAVAVSVLTMGAATPISLFVTSLVLAHLGKLAAAATALTACVVTTPSVLKSSIYAHQVKRGSIALAGEALGKKADADYRAWFRRNVTLR